MNIERVELCTELLKKSSKIDFCIKKEVYEYNNIQEIVDKIKKQYGLIVKVVMLDDVCISVEVKQ